MTTRVRRRMLFAWLPRAILIVTAILAPVIDRGDRDPEPTAESAIHSVDPGAHVPA